MLSETKFYINVESNSIDVINEIVSSIVDESYLRHFTSNYRSTTQLVENAIPWCTFLDYKGQGWGCGRMSRRSTLLSTTNMEQSRGFSMRTVAVFTPTLTKFMWHQEPRVCIWIRDETHPYFFSLRPRVRPLVEPHAGYSARSDTFATTWLWPRARTQRTFVLRIAKQPSRTFSVRHNAWSKF